MTLANTSLVPEFQHYFHDFVLSSTINKNQVPIPVDVDPRFLTDGSVVELLFQETFPYDTYTYLYENETALLCWPTLTRERLMIYPSSEYLLPGTVGDNVFNLLADDLAMLDVLVYYRHDSTSVILIDTTSNIIVDATTNISISIDTTTGIVIVEGNVNNLSTPLSKLIFLYLDLKINGNYSSYANMTTIVSDCSMLATAFELLLLDEYFEFVSANNTDFSIDCSTEEVSI